MSRECCDCFYCSPKNGSWYCKKRSKYVAFDDLGCSYFIHKDSAKTYLCCYYYQTDGSYFAKMDDAYCNKHKKKIKTDTLACSSFIED